MPKEIDWAGLALDRGFKSEKAMLKKYYIKDNWAIKRMQTEFGVSFVTIQGRLKSYDLNKTPKATSNSKCSNCSHCRTRVLLSDWNCNKYPAYKGSNIMNKRIVYNFGRVWCDLGLWMKGNGTPATYNNLTAFNKSVKSGNSTWLPDICDSFI